MPSCFPFYWKKRNVDNKEESEEIFFVMLDVNICWRWHPMATGKRTSRCVLDEWKRARKMCPLARTHLKRKAFAFA